MNPSSPAIEQAIDALKASPGTFQRLIEGYAQLAHRDLFPRLVPGGRRTDDVTRTGWPDATSELPDGATAILEATHSDSWERHLKDDVQRTEDLGIGAVRVFLFAAWTKSPEPDKLDPYRQRLLALGIPRDRILLLFRDQLLSELGRPLFARLWVDPLRLPVSCLPFDTVERVPRLFGSEERADLFAPRRSEYQAGLVYRPCIADTVEERLTQSGWALLRGRGAAGKTTLALCIALGPSYRGYPVYYLDLADWDENEGDLSDAIETIAIRGDSGVLFVVDNVHIAPDTADRIFTGWQELSANGSRLLLLGRLVTPEPDVRGRAYPLEELDRETLELTIDTGTLEGVYRRIVGRFQSPNGIPTPPPVVVESWLRIFGGDLIAFSTAVAQRFRHLLRGEWGLAPEDARRYVEKEYVQGLNQAEREVMVRLASIATFELTAPAESLGFDVTSRLLESGWIIRAEHGGGRFVHFRLVHPGLGDLILAALQPVDKLEVFRNIAAEDSFLGILIARNLMLQDRHAETRVILSAIADSPRWYSRVFAGSWLPTTVILFDKYKVLTSKAVDERLCCKEYSEHVLDEAMISLRNISMLVSFSRFSLPNLHESIIRMLSAEENQDALTGLALRSPLSHLSSFLGFAQVNLPVVYESIVESLSAEKNQSVLDEAALKTPLDHLSSFLSFAQVNLPATYESIVEFLSTEESRSFLTGTALRTPLGHLSSFLSFAQVNLPAVYKSLLEALSFEENQGILTGAALRAPLDQLVTFLSFIQMTLPGMHEFLIKVLLAGGSQGGLQLALTPSLSLTALSAFLKQEELAAVIVESVDPLDWEKWWLNNPGIGVETLPTVGRQLTKFGRPELAVPLARGVIIAAEVSEWNRSRVGLKAFSHAIRLAGNVEQKNLDLFLSRIATPHWLRSRYQWLDPGPLAGALFALWNSLDSERFKRFRAPHLLEIVERKINSWTTAPSPFLADLVSLLGVGTLLGLTRSGAGLAWASEWSLHQAIAERNTFEEEAFLGPLQVQFWLGIRRLTSQRKTSLKLSTKEGSRLLQLWRDAMPEEEKLKILNVWMLGWLERCAASGWLLLPDDTPLKI